MSQQAVRPVSRSEVAGKAVRRKNGPTGNAGLRVWRSSCGTRSGSVTGRCGTRSAAPAPVLDERGRHDGDGASAASPGNERLLAQRHPEGVAHNSTMTGRATRLSASPTTRVASSASTSRAGEASSPRSTKSPIGTARRGHRRSRRWRCGGADRGADEHVPDLAAIERGVSEVLAFGRTTAGAVGAGASIGCRSTAPSPRKAEEVGGEPDSWLRLLCRRCQETVTTLQRDPGFCRGENAIPRVTSLVIS